MIGALLAVFRKELLETLRDRLCAAFEGFNRDYGVVVVSDCVHSMYGDDLHEFGLENVARCFGWVLSVDDQPRTTVRLSPAWAPRSRSVNPGINEPVSTRIQKFFCSVKPRAVGAVSVIGLPSHAPHSRAAMTTRARGALIAMRWRWRGR